MPTRRKKVFKSENHSFVAAGEKPTSLWSKRGTEDVNFQRGAQVTLWSIMGGLQVAALLTQVDNLWEQLQAGRWYLSIFLIDTLLIITLIWALSSWQSLILKWTIDIPTILTQFLGNFVLAITCLLVANPAGWSLSLAISATCNWLHNFLLSKTGAWEPASPEIVKRLKANLLVFSIWPLLAYAGAIHMFFVPSMLIQAIWGMVAFAIIIEGLLRQQKDINRDRKELGIP